ncbi:Cu2+-exporting ATPase [Plasticicumulans acidivorans]|uniref:Cu2+-exporting ATPase n=1 Tax=Plasticicumulans acidivorans TaxID=886464 RepID=A0A317N062_9GAMM|nr:Cu2+-exporting ATPase [Plasticicumulans acidivorans]
MGGVLDVSEQDSTEAASVDEEACFHCGLPIPAGVRLRVTVDGASHPLCCHGCQAVAQAIVDAGLTDYYRHRTSVPKRAEDLIPAQLRGLDLYDRADLQRSFVRTAGEGDVREASLILEGIVCAACVWLNERHVSGLPGVIEFRVNYSTHRAQLRWDDSRIHLSEILRSIAAIGYVAHPFDPGRQEALQKQERARALRRLAVAGLGAMQVMMLAVAMYAGDWYGMDLQWRTYFRWISLLIAVPTVIYSGGAFMAGAWRDLKLGRLGMDVPITLAIVLATLASIWFTLMGGGEVYYDSVTMFVFFLLSGRFLEMAARHRCAQVSEELSRILPATASRIDADGNEEVVAVAELATGDHVRVRPGETVPADATILDGCSSVDESLLTGESLPSPRGSGDQVIGGSVNIESPLLIRVDTVGTETVLSSIVRLLDRAQGEKPRIAALADRLAAWFVATQLLICVAVGAWWWWHDPAHTLPVVLSVLVVTCPCALGLATPAAVTAATGALTRIGLLTTRGHALETLARATHVVFDKTGTLTFGRLQLVRTVPLGQRSGEDCLKIAAALECGSEHPVGQALVDAAGTALVAAEVSNTPGLGIEGSLDGVKYRVGRAPAGVEPPASAEGALTWVALSSGPEVLAWFGLADRLRPDARATVDALHAAGLQVYLLSGDRPQAAALIAADAGIEHTEGGLMPADKLVRLQGLQAGGAVVAMVGDGINDAPVLAAANVSIAMGSGTQLAHASADMILISSSLEHIATGVGTARKTLRIIRQNLLWALMYNAIALPAAAAGWITPWMSAIGMSASSLLVVANALRLRAGR